MSDFHDLSILFVLTSPPCRSSELYKVNTQKCISNVIFNSIFCYQFSKKDEKLIRNKSHPPVCQIRCSLHHVDLSIFATLLAAANEAVMPTHTLFPHHPHCKLPIYNVNRCSTSCFVRRRRRGWGIFRGKNDHLFVSIKPEFEWASLFWD